VRPIIYSIKLIPQRKDMSTAHTQGSQQPRVAFCAFLIILVAAILAGSFEFWRLTSGAKPPATPNIRLASTLQQSSSDAVVAAAPTSLPQAPQRVFRPSPRTVVKSPPENANSQVEPSQAPPTGGAETVQRELPVPPRGIGLEFRPHVRYGALAGSQVRLDGASSIRDWQMSGKMIGGYLEAEQELPLNPAHVREGWLAVRGESFVPVRSLVSVEDDGRPYSTRMDNEVYAALHESQYKQITYHVTGLWVTNLASTQIEPGGQDSGYHDKSKPAFMTTGELVIAGITNQLQMAVTITKPADARRAGSVKISGQTMIRMTDFKIAPPEPSIGLGMIKVEDRVKLSFEWVIAPSRTSS